MGYKKVEAYACDKCGHLFYSQVDAERCHKEYKCRGCGKPTSTYITLCEDCNNKRILEEVNKISYDDYSGDMFYDESTDQYFSDFDEMSDYYHNNVLDKDDTRTLEEVLPKFVYACSFAPFGFYFSDAVEEACEDHHEDIMDHLHGIDEMEKLVQDWCEEQNTGSYYQDSENIILMESILKWG